ncbi:MAG: HAD family hydrolase [Leptolyngbyaceae bacterium]|nr:HAD family hydrolase [Leptolyngbyaceae bacterium]
MSNNSDPPSLPDHLAPVQIVATDMDGTLTRDGKFSATLIHALESLQQAGLDVIIVTGRSAGWVQSVMHYLPIWGAIAENGGVFFAADDTPKLIPLIENMADHRRQLHQTFQHCQALIPTLQESSDNPFRLTDWTFSVEGLSQDEIEALGAIAENHQWSFTYSTVQCHIKPKNQSKAIALQYVLDHFFPDVPSSAVITVGDSPNDESLFDPTLVPVSIGVANIRDYLDRLSHHPTHITRAPEVEGFQELTQLILKQHF